MFPNPSRQQGPSPAQQSPVAYVGIYQPSNIPGPYCPRCNSPYTNQQGKDRTLFVKVIASIFVVTVGCFIWATLVALALIWALPKSFMFVCKTCGYAFNFDQYGYLPDTSKRLAIVVAGGLVILQMALYGGLAIYNQHKPQPINDSELPQAQTPTYSVAPYGYGTTQPPYVPPADYPNPTNVVPKPN